MHIFALETDVNKIKQRFCHGGEGEKEVFMTYYHGLSFFFAILREMLITTVLAALGVAGWIYQWPVWWTVWILASVWFVLVFFNIIKAYIDWAYDFILITTDKIILVDQTSFFKQEIKPIHLENVGAVSTRTQYWDIFPFGVVCIHLKEGLGGDRITKKYIPHASKVAGILSEVVTEYQRRMPGGGVLKS
ncbi:MAG: hypothetical protein UY77_C0019G0025 [Candidatus Uhrbacteria bacterium GW2011_GWA2_53_10]|uniref:DUF304 domain-containing protein n=1 Tax=Candidatus Uhrbacteria bacterium GW2011_GWA2_53_10 TaxID=1618980 RepID=A0A0G1XNS1_9BACT|nr:MAG: hypothetical protein UY77_C0019G0025 [Candidatus Uhrbacteria bacterium GW2011_GWA2_53_10]